LQNAPAASLDRELKEAEEQIDSDVEVRPRACVCICTYGTRVQIDLNTRSCEWRLQAAGDDFDDQEDVALETISEFSEEPPGSTSRHVTPHVKRHGKAKTPAASTQRSFGADIRTPGMHAHHIHTHARAHTHTHTHIHCRLITSTVSTSGARRVIRSLEEQIADRDTLYVRVMSTMPIL